MDKKNQITEGVIWKQLLIFFFPIMVGTLFQQLYNTVDAIIVGRFVGKQALASVGGAAAVLTNFVIGVFTGLSAGATVIISSHNLNHTVDVCPRIALLENGVIIRDIRNENNSAEQELEA